MDTEKKKYSVFIIILILNIIFNIAIFNDPISAPEKKIILATDPWAPHYGPNMENNGYFTEIAKEAFKRAGYQCEIKFVPWKRAIEHSKTGEYHGLLGAFYTEERTEYFKYSDPVSESHLAFFSKKGMGIHYKILKDLSPYKIGVIRGYQYSEEFDSADYIYKEEVPSVEQNIKKVISGRIDIFIDSEEVVLWILRTKLPDYIDLLEKIEPSYKINKLYIPISKKVTNYDQVVNDFNNGLKIIREDGTFDKIMKHHGF